MEPLRIGFIGAGGFARHTIYPALHLAPVALQAICDVDEAKAKDAAGKFGTGVGTRIAIKCGNRKTLRHSSSL